MNQNIRVIKRGNHVQGVLYDTALNEAAYGRPEMMGDLFGDVMGAVIGKDNWDARPDWLKKVKIKPNPEALVKAVPPKVVGTVAKQAEKVGINIFYRTPGGDVRITPDMAEGAYSNFPAFSKAMQGFSAIPTWAYLAAGAGVILLVFAARK